MLAKEFPDAPDEGDDATGSSKKRRPGAPRSRTQGHELRLASESRASQTPEPANDAADAFLARLERVDAGTLDISQLIDDLPAAATPADTPTAVAQPSRSDVQRATAPALASTSSPSPAAGPRTATKQAPAARKSLLDVPVPDEDVAADAGADSAVSGGSSRQPANGVRLALFGLGALAIVGIASVALQRSPPAGTSSATGSSATSGPASEAGARPVLPAATAPNAAASLDTRVNQLADTARQRLAAGQRSEAVDALTEGLALRSTDVTLQSLATQLLADAREAYAGARRDARAINATGTPRYVEAERLVRDVTRRRGVPVLDAARSYESAIANMNAASDEARKAADARAAATLAASSSAASATTAVSTSTPQASAPSLSPAAARTADVSAPAVQSAPSAVASSPAVAAPRPETTTPPVAAPVPTREAPVAQSPAAPAVPAPATVTAAREAAPTRSAAGDEQSIRGVLQAYADAYSRLDARAVQGVYPSTDIAGLERSFARMRSQRVQIANERIQVNGATATVTCIWQTVFELSAAAPNRSAPQTTLTLQRSGDTWLIVGRR